MSQKKENDMIFCRCLEKKKQTREIKTIKKKERKNSLTLLNWVCVHSSGSHTRWNSKRGEKKRTIRTNRLLSLVPTAHSVHAWAVCVCVLMFGYFLLCRILCSRFTLNANAPFVLKHRKKYGLVSYIMFTITDAQLFLFREKSAQCNLNGLGKVAWKKSHPRRKKMWWKRRGRRSFISNYIIDRYFNKHFRTH